MDESDYKKAYEGKTILITGGAGAIGSNLTKILGEAKAKLVIVFDDLSSASKWNVPSLKNVLFVEGSILDEVKLKRVFFEEPEIVFHLAALFANQNSIDHPENDLLVNGLGTLKLLQYSKLSNVKRFIYVSSGCSIYGSNSPLPLTEEHISLHLSSPYQITKMLGELYCNFFYQHHKLQIVKPRLFNSYGPGELPGQYRNVIPNFIYLAMQCQPLPITGTGEETRDFTFVGDIVDGLLRAGYFKTAIGQSFNLASGKETRIIDLAQMVNEAVGNSAGVTFNKRREWDTKTRLLASIERANNLIGFQPCTQFSDGLRQTVDWFKSKWDRIILDASFNPGVSTALRQVVCLGENHK
jgi:nucleoside-diphosphate-sugar epimerase